MKLRCLNQVNLYNILSTFCTVALAYSVTLSPVNAQQIIIDGNTNTNLSINGSTTTVTTSTIKNSNAFNSFKKFNVNSGNTVNLVVPGTANNLINLVHSEKTDIQGTLNALQNGKIGGNVYIVNLHGIVVGQNGVINVGSLTAVTPTQTFMNNFFSSKGNPDNASVNALVNGTMPVNPNAKIINEGTINIGNKGIFIGGSFENYGNLYSCAVFDDSDLKNIVNLNSFEKGVNMTNQNGEILITSEKDVNSLGNIVANQKTPYNIEFHSKTGNVNIAAKMVGRVKALANNGNVNLIQFNGDLNLYKAKAKNDVNIVASGSINDGNSISENPNVIGKNINMLSVFGNIGSNKDDLNIETNHKSSGGVLNAWAPNGSIHLNQATNKMGIDFISAKDDVVLVSNDSIIDESTGENPNVTGHNITLISNNGMVGQNYIDEDINIQSNINSNAPRGIVHIFAGGDDAAIQQTKGKLYIDSIYANNTAAIRSGGSIIGTSGGADIVAKNVRLSSDYGSIKGDGRNLIIDVDNPSCTGTSVHWSGKGTLVAEAADEVRITDIADDLLIDYVTAGNNIEIIADGSILNGAQMPQWNSVSGSNIVLKSLSGGIGDSNDSLIVDTIGGALTANATGDIFIDSNKDLWIDSVETQGNITLKSQASMFSNDPGKINIIGADINLQASKAIGTSLTPIKVKSNTKKVKTSATSTNIVQY